MFSFNLFYNDVKRYGLLMDHFIYLSPSIYALAWICCQILCKMKYLQCKLIFVNGLWTLLCIFLSEAYWTNTMHSISDDFECCKPIDLHNRDFQIDRPRRRCFLPWLTRVRSLQWSIGWWANRVTLVAFWGITYRMIFCPLPQYQSEFHMYQ